MLSPNANFVAAIAEDLLRIAELYIFTLSDGSIHRYTSHSQDISWNGTYIALPIVRGALESKINSEPEMVSIVLQNITGDFYNKVQKNILDSVEVVIKRIIWDETYAADMEIIIFRGSGDVEFNRMVLTLNCRSILDSLNIIVPKDVYQEPCNKKLFDDDCGLTRADFAYEGTATNGTDVTLIDSARGTVYKGTFDNTTGTIVIGDTITGGNNAYTAVVIQIIYLTATTGFIWYVELSNSANFEDDEVLANGADNVTLNGVPVADSTFYQQGELEMTSGDNNGQRRPILKDSGNTITIVWPLVNDAAGGDTYKIYPGCDKRTTTCLNKFGNINNFRGFIYIPRIEETIF